MYLRPSSILLMLFVFAVVIQYETEAKAILEAFFDYSKFQNNHYHHHRHHGNSAPQYPKPEPVGGKERFKQICNVIHGISDCYA